MATLYEMMTLWETVIQRWREYYGRAAKDQPSADELMAFFNLMQTPQKGGENET